MGEQRCSRRIHVLSFFFRHAAHALSSAVALAGALAVDLREPLEVLATGFLAAGFWAVGGLAAAVFSADVLADAVFAAGFLVAAFLVAGFFAAGFLVAGFFAGAGSSRDTMAFGLISA